MNSQACYVLQVLSPPIQCTVGLSKRKHPVNLFFRHARGGSEAGVTFDVYFLSPAWMWEELSVKQFQLSSSRQISKTILCSLSYPSFLWCVILKFNFSFWDCTSDVIDSPRTNAATCQEHSPLPSLMASFWTLVRSFHSASTWVSTSVISLIPYLEYWSSNYSHQGMPRFSFSQFFVLFKFHIL